MNWDLYVSINTKKLKLKSYLDKLNNQVLKFYQNLYFQERANINFEVKKH
jgi:hypothetical protein